MPEDELLEIDLPPSPHGIIWHAPGTKTYFVGTDRGVLYPENGPGVAWNGLVSVDEKTTGGELQPFYLDGVRRRNDHFNEEFEATLSAYQAPHEFGPCVGELELAPGLLLAQQTREPFGLSYRTFIGNDIQGMDADYELHLIYGAMAQPSSRSHKSISSSPSPDTLTWDIATVPVEIRDAKPTAHIRLDTRRVDRARLTEIEDILYGRALEAARLPEIEEIFEILSRIDIVPVEEVPEEEIPWEDLEG